MNNLKIAKINQLNFRAFIIVKIMYNFYFKIISRKK